MTDTKILTIYGMNCQHCVQTVKKALEKLDGVKSVVVNFEEEAAYVELTEEVEDSVLTNAVEESGYSVESIRDG